MATLSIRRFLVFLFSDWILYVASVSSPVYASVTLRRHAHHDKTRRPDNNQRDGWANAKVFEFVQQARMNMGKLVITLEQVPGHNRISSLKQGTRFRRNVQPCSNCGYKVQRGKWYIWRSGIPYTQILCNNCHFYSRRTDKDRPGELERRRVEHQELRRNKSDDPAWKEDCRTNGKAWGRVSKLWICGTYRKFENTAPYPLQPNIALLGHSIRRN